MHKLGAGHRRKRWINLLLVIPSFAVMAGLSLGAVWLIQQLQSLRCPSGTVPCCLRARSHGFPDFANHGGVDWVRLSWRKRVRAFDAAFAQVL
jgi:hypothetical protein